MANKFESKLMSKMAESEQRVEAALNGKPEQMVKPLNEISGDQKQTSTRNKELNTVENSEQGNNESTTNNDSTIPVSVSSNKSKTPSATVLTGKEAFRQEHQQYLREADMSYTKSSSFYMPKNVRDKFTEIQNELNNTNKMYAKLSQQDIINILVWEGVEKWYTSITGRKGRGGKQ